MMKNWIKYRKIVSKKFPSAIQSLNIGATAENIQKLQDSFKYQLPISLVELLKENDGESENSQGVIFGINFLSITSIIRDLNSWQNILDEGLDGLNDFCKSKPEGAIKCEYANAAWLPLFSDGCGNFIGLDLDPDIQGISGQIINFGRDEDSKYVLAKNLDQFIALLCDLVQRSDIQVDSSGGFSINHIHFIDAIKNLEKISNELPPVDNGYYSFWICTENKNHIPEKYFDIDNDGGNGLRSFINEFNINLEKHHSFTGTAYQNGNPGSLEMLLKYQSYSANYLEKLKLFAKKREIDKVGYIHILQNYIYDPEKSGISENDLLVFMGSYKVY